LDVPVRLMKCLAFLEKRSAVAVSAGKKVKMREKEK
jgi:hypothetical protein